MSTLAPPKYFRRVIRVKATDSPNVRLGLAQERAGTKPTNETLVPGLLSYAEYKYRRAVWDRVRQSVGLDGEFWEGSELLLFPPDWLNEAEQRAVGLPLLRKARGGGCDPGEGGDKTAFAAVDEYGLLDLESNKTPNTIDVVTQAIAFMEKWQIPAERFIFDRGGGGKQHADYMRAIERNGHRPYRHVRTVNFGEPPSLPIKYGKYGIPTRQDALEDRTAYTSLRVQMYHELSQAIDPGLPGTRFALPAKVGKKVDEFAELRRQLCVFPKQTDRDGKYKLPPKQNPTDPDDPETLINMIGRSPDEADAVVLAYHAMTHDMRVVKIGAL